MFDHIFQITLESHSAYDQLQGLDLGFQQWATRRISRIIGGLENRYDAVLISQKVPDWLPGEHMPTCAVFQVGVCVNINALEVVQRFDPLSDTESAFDALWGEKSELRRFADGAIVKSVLFDCDGTTHQKTMVFPRMAAYLISKHLGSPETSYWCGLGLKFLKPPGLVGSHTFQPVLEAFQSVRKVLVAFKELPLSVASVHGLSSVLSQSSVFVPVPRANEYSPVTTIDALIVFESSNRWPDNLQAIQVMKRAFFVRICQLYNALGQGRAHVELGSNETIFDSGALVLDHLGYTFRFKIHHNREELLLQRLIDTSAPFAHRAAQAVYMETYHMIPYHTSLMGVLTSRFPYLGVSIRLLKRWASAHMLVTDGCSAGINTYVLELLCASVYLKPAPYAVPLSGFTGFLRVLDQMVRWDFNIEPLIVELESGKMTPQMVLEINDKHAQLKKGGHGHIGVYIATERDLGATWWAMQTTSLKIFDKLRVTAHASLSYLSSNLKHGLGPAVDTMFLPNASHYDFAIHLNTALIPQFRYNLTFDQSSAAQLDPKFKNVKTSIETTLDTTHKFDPVRMYVQDLDRAFDQTCLFFYDCLGGGDTICGVWKCKAIPKFKVDGTFNSYQEDGETRVNYDAMLAEMCRLGQGLVVEVSKKQ